MDFYKIKHRTLKKGNIEVYPEFYSSRSKDLMTRGKSFYAVWNSDKEAWSTDEYDIQQLIDKDLYEYAKKLKSEYGNDDDISVATLGNYSTGKWLEYCNLIKHSPDNYVPLDGKLTFANTKTVREDYASKRLPYPLEKGDYSAWDELVGTLYEPEEREKIEWAIGSIVVGDAKTIQKFLVLYGEAGSGKSTILHIIEKLFEGYYATFEAKALGQNNNAFATEAFKSNPLVAIQHDGDLSRIEDNSKLNSIISHEDMLINEKYKSGYTSRINCFLFMATNRPVKITDAKSGIIRRLIDVHPANRLIPSQRYIELMERIKFQLGAIAWRCKEVYEECGKHYYDAYKPLDMMYKTDVFYNFVEDSYDVFKEQNGVSLKQAWDMYKTYCDEALVDHKLPMYRFREELKNYFASYKDFVRIDNKQYRKYYSGFIIAKFANSEKVAKTDFDTWLKFNRDKSLFDILAEDYPAQEADDEEKPFQKWDDCKTTLKDIDTSKVHYVRVPLDHIVIDFDLKDENGAKSYEKNLEAASKFPPTYAELSKSGAGIHLHYIYSGDVEKLKDHIDEDIEIKVFKGKSSLRRRLVRCNDIPIATINSGLPLKEKETQKMIDNQSIENEKHIRNRIAMALRKEVEPRTTTCCVSFIKMTLDTAYAQEGLTYDVSDMKNDILEFAKHSTHQAQNCVNMCMQMKFMSKDHEQGTVKSDLRFDPDAKIVFFDIESFPNLFVLCWKYQGAEVIHTMVNPSAQEMHDFIWTPEGKLRYKLVGYNNKNYDNPMIYGVSVGDTVYDSFMRSQAIIVEDENQPIASKDISYTDVLDYSSIKQSLKKFEIQLKIPHKECPFRWDKPVPEESWPIVIDYCKNDVFALEAVHDYLHEDYKARLMLAKAAGETPNTSTNNITASFIFGDDRHPQSQFNYRFMGDIPNEIYVLNTDTFELTKEVGKTAEQLIAEEKFSVFDMNMRPVFPGYTFDQYKKTGKSQYRGEDPKEGGYVYAEEGMYTDVPVLDIASMHPSSVVAEELFGPKYTKRFKDILDLRLYIKHGKYDAARKLLGGVFAEYLDDEKAAKRLSKVLKIPINAVYGQSSAKYPNRFKDKRNVDNIVAKRGALFMINLKHEVQKRGFTVAHIKTDSIKIPNATKEIIDFVTKYGEMYGYKFEHEATYARMCLVNKSTYIAKYTKPYKDESGNDIYWTATAAQFAHPYVFKKLFSKQPIEFDDLCETKQVTSAIYIDMNENLPDVSALEAERDKLKKKKAKEATDIYDAQIAELNEQIEKGHKYVFIGKIGQFCPMKPGTGGGILLREHEDGYAAVGGTIGYRWMESDVVQSNHKEKDIDMSYFERLADSAINDISEYGDFTWFTSDDDIKTVFESLDIKSDELPF